MRDAEIQRPTWLSLDQLAKRGLFIRVEKEKGRLLAPSLSFETNQLPSVLPFYRDKLATTNSAGPIGDWRRAVSLSIAQREHA